jgi:CDP-6-deoxy-D-xylo-4-hexulose-3-dehydrase
MTTIEGGMVCTDDEDTYQTIRMLRSHGMVRESTDDKLKLAYKLSNPELNPDFIFAHAAYNMRNNELGGILGVNQIGRLNDNVEKRNRNHELFLSKLDADKYYTGFKLVGASNYAFNLILNNKDDELVTRLMNKMKSEGVEFRRGSAGGGNQLRQPYLRDIVPKDYHLQFPNTEHIHFYGFYIGNFPSMTEEEVCEIADIVNKV